MTGLALLTLLLTSVVSSTASTPSFDKLRESCLFNSEACCFTSNEHPWVQTEPWCKFNETTQSYPCSVKLGVSNQVGSLVNAYVAKVFIEEFLGYPVEINDFTKFVTSSNEVERWELLEEGIVDALLDVTGSLEVEDEFIVQRRTVNGAGSLGLSQTLGWYVPSYMTEPCTATNTKPLCDTSLTFSESWLTLPVPANIKKLSNKAQNLPCCYSGNYDSHCMPDATLGGTPVKAGGLENSSICEADPTRLIPSYGGRLLAATRTSTEFEKAVIDQLGLNLTIEFAGTEFELVQQLEAAQDTQEGLLMLLSSSHPIVQRYNLTKITLPSSLHTCSLGSGNSRRACEYQAEYPLKVYRSALAEEMPDLARLLELFRFSTNVKQMEAVSSILLEGSSLLEASCSFVKAQLSDWKPMLERMEQTFNDTFVHGHLPRLKTVNCGCLGNGSRTVVQVWQTEDFEYAHVVGDTDPCKTPTYSSFISRWTKIHLATKIVDLVNCNYAELTSLVSIVAMSVGGVTCLALMLAMGVVFYLRNEPHMKASNVTTVLTFLLGAITMNLYCLSNLGPVGRYTCLIRAALFVYGCGWFIGSLLVKEVALFVIFFVGGKYTTYTAAWLKYQVLVCAALATPPFLVWALTAGFQPFPSKLVQLSDFQVYHCPKDVYNKYFGSVIAGLTVLLVCYMSYMTRGISGTFTEGKNVLLIAYLVAVLGVLMMIVLPMSGLRREYSVLISEVAMAFITLTAAAAIIGPRVHSYYVGHQFDRDGLYKTNSEQVMQRAKGKQRTRTALHETVDPSVFENEIADVYDGSALSTSSSSNPSQLREQRTISNQREIQLAMW